MIAIIGKRSIGKTSLLKKLANAGYSILNVDAWVHKEYANPQGSIYKEIVKLFGNQIITNNIIDREILKQYIKDDFNNLFKIEEIVHPKIYDFLIKNKFDFVEIPILSFSNIKFENLFKKIIKIYSKKDENKNNYVGNFYNDIQSINNRPVRYIKSVDIDVQNTKNIQNFIKLIQ